MPQLPSQSVAGDHIVLKRRELQPADVRVVDPRGLGRALRGAVVGNVIEWYEFGVFGFLIVTMGPVFLPEANPTVQSLYLFGTFAVTFVARPIGGIFFGWLGDRIGRRRVLSITLLIMSMATLCTGLLPGYAVIGLWAPALLVALRLVQGFSASGEYTGAATFLSEYAPDRQRGFFVGMLASTTYVGFAAGAAIVGVLQATTSDQFMFEWGWRIPFLVAAPMTAIAMYFRYRVDETPAFVELQRERALSEERRGDVAPSLSVGEVLRRNWRSVIPVIGVAATGNVIAYTMLSYAPTYLNQTLGFEGASGNLILFPLYLFAAVATVAAGALTDKVGRKPVLYAGALIGMVLAVPAFLLMGSGHVALASAGALMIMLCSSVFSQSYASTLPEQFPTESRSSSLGLAYNLGNSAFGGTAPLVIGWLVATTGSTLVPAYYLMIAAGVALIAIRFLRETSTLPLDGSMPSVRFPEEVSDAVSRHSQTSEDDRGRMPLPWIAYTVDEHGNEGAIPSRDPRATEAARRAQVQLAQD